MIEHVLQSIGEWQSVHTLVDYYQYIKGVEYLICVAFFIAFPMYYKYLNSNSVDANK
ncbi:MAG: hypothetical protein P1P74_06385 [Desulfuromonadales bacterium]|nr:hypothetical protein [Desulfuromonadales bacterium]MDT8422999.1 hypothetical protein [Desulfuromonadales bacterium]